jgi:hypothetical protein
MIVSRGPQIWRMADWIGKGGVEQRDGPAYAPGLSFLRGYRFVMGLWLVVASEPWILTSLL